MNQNRRTLKWSVSYTKAKLFSCWCELFKWRMESDFKLLDSVTISCCPHRTWTHRLTCDTVTHSVGYTHIRKWISHTCAIICCAGKPWTLWITLMALLQQHSIMSSKVVYCVLILIVLQYEKCNIQCAETNQVLSNSSVPFNTAAVQIFLSVWAETWI